MIDKRVITSNERVDMADKCVMKNSLLNKMIPSEISLINRIATSFQLIAFLLFVQSTSAQQLVFNGSFEDVNICDEYHAPCGPAAWFFLNKTSSVGYGRQGEIGAKVQNRFLSILVARPYIKTREYWQTRLGASLVAGRKYKAFFKLEEDNLTLNLEEIGFFFSTDFIDCWKDSLLQPENYIGFEDAKRKKKKNNWVQIEKEFVAPANARYLIIGNFVRTSNDEILELYKQKGKRIYVAIDDVSIECLENDACTPDPLLKDSLYSITRRHYIEPPPPKKKEASRLKDPVIIEEPATKTDTLRISSIEFAFNKHTLKEVTILDSYKSQLSKSNIDHINVIGYTDSSGTQKYNNELSTKRAAEIARIIQSRFGIGTTLINYEGRGESVQYNDDSMNRRVEIIIYYK